MAPAPNLVVTMVKSYLQLPHKYATTGMTRAATEQAEVWQAKSHQSSFMSVCRCSSQLAVTSSYSYHLLNLHKRQLQAILWSYKQLSQDATTQNN